MREERLAKVAAQRLQHRLWKLRGGEARVSNEDGDRALPYVPGWRHIFTDTRVENERERVEWITNALLPAKCQAFSSLGPTSMSQLSTHVAILICV